MKGLKIQIQAVVRKWGIWKELVTHLAEQWTYDQTFSWNWWCSKYKGINCVFSLVMWHNLLYTIIILNRKFYFSFFSRTSRLLNPLPNYCFPGIYTRENFKFSVNRHLLSSWILFLFALITNDFSYSDTPIKLFDFLQVKWLKNRFFYPENKWKNFYVVDVGSYQCCSLF